MTDIPDIQFSTKLLHNGYEIDPITGALSLPVHNSTTFHQTDIDNPTTYDYSRSGNPTREALEKTIALLEEGTRGFAFSSGMAAISSVLSIFSAGDHLVVCEDGYGGLLRAARTIFPRFGFSITFIDATRVENIEAALQENTKAIYLETPANPLLGITDLAAVAALARSHDILTIVDNTFMSPYLQRPLTLGIDVVIHSATKFIGGHSDVLSGLVVVKDGGLAKRIYALQNGFGAVLGPQDCWLILRGLKTLKVRLDYQQASAERIAQWLTTHELIEQVYYPGLPEHPGYDTHRGQADGPGAVLSFRTKDAAIAHNFLQDVTLAAVAVSLGGVETIVSYPSHMSHASVPPKERDRLGITDSLIRISAGLEDTDDLINDFDNALRRKLT